MTFIFFEKGTRSPLVAWQDGRLIGRQDRVRSILGYSVALRGRFFGVEPLGPGAIENHIRNPFAALDLILEFFREQGILAIVKGDIPKPAPIPDGAIQ